MPESTAWAQVIAFAGMIVDDIKEDLEASPMQGVHHGFELHTCWPTTPVLA